MSAGGDETRGPGRRLVLGLPAPLAAPVPLDASARTSSPAGRPRGHSWPRPEVPLAATVLLSSGSTSHDWHLNLSVNLGGLDNFGQWARARFILLCLGATVGNLLRHPFPQPPGTAQEHCVLREELIWASRSSLGRCSVGAWQPQTTRPQVKGQGGTEPTRRGSGSLWSQEETDGTLKWGRREFNKETIYKGTESKLGEPQRKTRYSGQQPLLLAGSGCKKNTVNSQQPSMERRRGIRDWPPALAPSAVLWGPPTDRSPGRPCMRSPEMSLWERRGQSRAERLRRGRWKTASPGAFPRGRSFLVSSQVLPLQDTTSPANFKALLTAGNACLNKAFILSVPTAGLEFKKLHFQDWLLLMCLTWNLQFGVK